MSCESRSRSNSPQIILKYLIYISRASKKYFSNEKLNLMVKPMSQNDN